MNASERWVALVTSEAPPVEGRPTHHYVASIAEDTGDLVVEEELPWPTVLLIRPGKESGFLLYRYTQDGRFAGDTWHLTLEDAKHQADFEFGESLGAWREVPAGVPDPITFALQERETN
jgi:hypothetical protein